MTLNEYQLEASKTALGLATETLWYPVLGLVGEAGEVAEKVKKYLRNVHKYGEDAAPDLDTSSLTLEMGDVLWYLSALASKIGVSLDEVATANLAKLSSRKSRGVLCGEGDNR